MIAPKFFVSVIPSKTKINNDLVFFNLPSKPLMSKVDTGEIVATIP